MPSASLIVGPWPSCPQAIRATAISLTVRRSYLLGFAQSTRFAHASCAACYSRYWRRSNPQADSPNSLQDNGLENDHSGLSVLQPVGDASSLVFCCPCLTSADADFRRLAESWSSLPSHIRLAINALLDSWSLAASAVSDATAYESLDYTPRRPDGNENAHCGLRALPSPIACSDLLQTEP